MPGWSCSRNQSRSWANDSGNGSCRGAGEIAGTSVRDHSLSVAVAKFDHTDLQVASLEVQSSAQSFTAGQTLARQLSAKPGLRAVFVLSEGLDVNGSELVRGLNSVLGVRQHFAEASSSERPAKR